MTFKILSLFNWVKNKVSMFELQTKQPINRGVIRSLPMIGTNGESRLDFSKKIQNIQNQSAISIYNFSYLSAILWKKKKILLSCLKAFQNVNILSMQEIKLAKSAKANQIYAF